MMLERLSDEKATSEVSSKGGVVHDEGPYPVNMSVVFTIAEKAQYSLRFVTSLLTPFTPCNLSPLLVVD